jgi:hypothetical protein
MLFFRKRTTDPLKLRTASTALRSARFRPSMEVLEDRCVPTTVTIDFDNLPLNYTEVTDQYQGLGVYFQGSPSGAYATNNYPLSYPPRSVYCAPKTGPPKGDSY